MIKFGMGHTLITFVDTYYEYGDSENILNRGLTIGGYELTWLDNLVAAYNLDNAKSLFTETTHDYGIYRDDGIVCFKGKSKNEDISR